MRRFLIVIACLSVIAPAHAAQKKPVALPFTTSFGGMVILPATFGKSVKGHVIFDTGSGLAVVAPSLARRLGAKPAGIFTAFRMNGERLNLPLYTISKLTVGPMAERNAEVATWKALDDPAFKEIQGIVSLRDFRHQPFTIDFGRKEFIFETQVSLAGRRRAGTTVPLKFDDERGIALDSFARFLIGSHSGECEIDTGSPGSTLSTRYAGRLGINLNGRNVSKREWRNLGTEVVDYGAVVPEIALAAAPAVSERQPHVYFSDIIYDCVIGLNFWGDRALTYDIPARELIVSH